MASTGEVWKLGHRPALDALRGYAVLLVLLGHAVPTEFVSAGIVGVSLFFVLSGFLITALLLEERQRAGGVDLGAFYLRRARRLFPALAAFLATMLALGLTLSAVFASPRAVLASAFYVGNWGQAFGHGSPGLGHMWSLAVEEQFYLVFPLVLVIALRRRSLRAVACWTAVVAAGSAVARIVLWDGGAGIERVYYGTDTNLAGLLAGCVLAMVLQGRPVPRLPRWPLLPAGVGLAVLTLSPEGFGARVAAPLAASALAVVVVGVLVTAGGGWLSSRPVVQHIGRRSYGLYLWHFPLLWVVVPAVGGSRWVTVPLALAAAWGLTVLSWRYVEAPFLAAQVTRKKSKNASTPPSAVSSDSPRPTLPMANGTV